MQEILRVPIRISKLRNEFMSKGYIYLLDYFVVGGSVLTVSFPSTQFDVCDIYGILDGCE